MCAWFLREITTVWATDRRVRTAGIHCIVPRLESYSLQISRVYMTKQKKRRRHFWSVPRLSWSLYGVLSACIRSSSHTPVCFTQGLQEASQEEEGGKVAEHPSGQLRVLRPGLLWRPGGQVRSSPCLPLSSLDVIISPPVSVSYRCFSVPTSFRKKFFSKVEQRR